MSKLTLLLTLLAFNFLNAPSNEPCSEWRLHQNKNAFKIYVRECPDSPIKEFKVVDRFYGNFEKIKIVLDDVETTRKISQNCTEARLLKTINANTVVQYFYFDLPIGITDRDIVSKNTTYMTATTYTSISEIYSGSDGLPERKGVIRLKNVRSSFYFEKMSDGTIKLEYTARADPNGWVPAWLVNMLASNEATKMTEKLKQLIR